MTYRTSVLAPSDDVVAEVWELAVDGIDLFLAVEDLAFLHGLPCQSWMISRDRHCVCVVRPSELILQTGRAASVQVKRKQRSALATQRHLFSCLQCLFSTTVS
jgi:hypothetical protein